MRGYEPQNHAIEAAHAPICTALHRATASFLSQP
jgi:hypothetical protein